MLRADSGGLDHRDERGALSAPGGLLCEPAIDHDNDNNDTTRESS